MQRPEQPEGTSHVAQFLAFLAVGQPVYFFPALAGVRPLLLCVVATGLAWFFRGEEKRGGDGREYRTVRRLVMLLALCECLPALLQLDRPLFLSTATRWAILAAAFLFILDLVDSEKQIWGVLMAMLGGAMLVIGDSTATYFFARETLQEGRLGGYGMYRGANDYGLLLTSSLPIILKRTELPLGVAYRIGLWALFAVAVGNLFLTASRGSMLGATTVVLFCLWTRKTLTRPKKIVVMVMVLVAGVALGAQALRAARGDVRLAGGDDSAEARKDAWAAAGRMLLDHPLGVGFDQSRELMIDYGMYRKIMPHNTYVKVAAEAGFLGFAAYVGLLYIVVNRLMRLDYFHRKIANDGRGTLAQALLFLLLGFMINTSFSQKEYEWILYIGLACALRLITLERALLEDHGPRG